MIFYLNNNGGVLGFSDININDQVFGPELGDVALLAEGQLPELVRIFLPISSRSSLL